jgi:hypothetical protein
MLALRAGDRVHCSPATATTGASASRPWSRRSSGSMSNPA